MKDIPEHVLAGQQVVKILNKKFLSLLDPKNKAPEEDYVPYEGETEDSAVGIKFDFKEGLITEYGLNDRGEREICASRFVYFNRLFRPGHDSTSAKSQLDFLAELNYHIRFHFTGRNPKSAFC
jgi:hypothetical protein